MRALPIVVERMKLGLLLDKLFCGSFHGDEVRQVDFDKKDRFFSRLPFELFDRRLRLFS